MKTLFYKIVLLLLTLLTPHLSEAQATYLTLQDAKELALANNRSLSVQKLEEKRSQEVTNEWRGKLLPSVQLNGTVSHYFDRQVIFLPGSFAGTSNPVQDVSVGGLNALNAGVTLHQPLLAKPIKRQKEVARLDEKIQKEYTREMKSQLMYQVTQEYYGIQLLKNQLELQHISLTRNQKALADSRSLLMAGRALKMDTLRSYIAVENLKSIIAYLNTTLEVANHRFKKLLGMDSATLELSDALVLEGESEKFSVLEQKATEALQHRNDILRQGFVVEREERQLSAVKGNFLPQVSLIGQYQLQAQADDLNMARYPFPKTGYLGLQVALPVFNGGIFNAKARQSKIKIEQEKLKLDDMKEEAGLELHTIAGNWKNAKAQLEIQKKTVEAATLNFSINSNRYLHDLGSMLEVNDAEVALHTAQLNYLMAVYELKVLTVAFEKALGSLE
ncbi:TolC family protein [Flavobacterium sp.]|uniref:TolC family protein n=1 Tax=Flavobacterium sp. TaxID=239 RepID=UPI002FDE7282